MGLRFRPREISEVVYRRLTGLLLLFPTTVVLCLAVFLEPNPAGFGTHTQLGLGSCSMMLLLGVPCPMCGMTTTFSLMAHGQWVSGFLNQPFGSLLFLATLAAALLGWCELLSPQGRLLRLFQWLGARDVPIIIGLLVGLAAGWGYKIFTLGIG